MVNIIEKDINKLFPHFTIIDWDGSYLLECEQCLNNKNGEHKARISIIAIANALDELKVWCDLNLPHGTVDDTVTVLNTIFDE